MIGNAQNEKSEEIEITFLDAARTKEVSRIHESAWFQSIGESQPRSVQKDHAAFYQLLFSAFQYIIPI